MLFTRLYDPLLAQASYLIGCQATGEAIVVDPNRDIAQYLAAARRERMRITHVTETHIHADFCSGSRELAQRTGAQLLLSGEGGEEWQYGFAAASGARLLRDGDRITIGRIWLDVRHTPGHTPEHLAFLVVDAPATESPLGVLTGDFVFVGDVGRPDLLERAVGREGTMAASARTLFRSLRAFKQLPDHLQIWPAHGAGSACGKALGAVPSSTLGYERMANWAFRITDEAEFVRAVLAGQPEPPRYFAVMKRLNRDGPPLAGRAHPERLDPARVAELRRMDATIVDTRPAAAFAAEHLVGAITLPLTRSFPGYAGWVLPYDRDVWLVCDPEHPEAVEEAVHHLALIGLDRVAGWFPLDDAGRDAWRAAGGETMALPQIAPRELAAQMEAGTVRVLDVRGRAEWEAGHLPDVPNLHFGQVLDRLAELPAGPLVLQCQTGARSAIAASLLQGRGRRDVVNLTGGYVAWQAADLPTATEQEALTA